MRLGQLRSHPRKGPRGPRAALLDAADTISVWANKNRREGMHAGGKKKWEVPSAESIFVLLKPSPFIVVFKQEQEAQNRAKVHSDLA